MSSWICAARTASSISSSDALGFANRRFSRTVAWKRYVSCETTPTVSVNASNVRARPSTPAIPHVHPVYRDRPARRVVEACDEVRGGRLARAGLTHEGRLASGRHGERDV